MVTGRYQTHNLGWNGDDAVIERERLKIYPFKADVVVLLRVTGVTSRNL